MLTDRDLQTLPNLGNEAEEAATDIQRLRLRLSRAEHWAIHAMLMRSTQNVELLDILRGDCGEAGHDQGKCGNASCL